jgi:hypothetical protein
MQVIDANTCLSIDLSWKARKLPDESLAPRGPGSASMNPKLERCISAYAVAVWPGAGTGLGPPLGAAFSI